jgi:flagellar protein FliL
VANSAKPDPRKADPEDDADADVTDGGAEDGDSGSGEKKHKIVGGKKLIFIVGGGVAAVVLLVVVLLVSGVFSSKKPAEVPDKAVEADSKSSDKPTFFNIPDMVVSLQSNGKKAGFLKVSISLELYSDKDKPAVEAVMPRIIDNFQMYLRELRSEDLRGSAGLYRLREELLIRVTAAAHPVRIKDVLFREMLVQ